MWSLSPSSSVWNLGRAGTYADLTVAVVDNFRNEQATNRPENVTAREVMELLTAKEEGAKYRMPKVDTKPQGEVPETPNAFSDGSLKHNKGAFWGVGGAGVGWLDRGVERVHSKL